MFKEREINYWNRYLVASGLLIALGLFILPAITSANSFYGTESLNPMVTEAGAAIYLPGGSQTMEAEAEYFLTDHLHSTRLAMTTDNTASEPTDYTPFGDNPNPASNT